MRFYVRVLTIVLAGLWLSVVVNALLIPPAAAIGIPDGTLAAVMLGASFGLPVALFYYLEERRDQKRAQVARSLGFSLLQKDDDEDLRLSLSAMPEFSQRAGTAIRNHYRTSIDGVEVSVFDYLNVGFPRIPWWFWFMLYWRGALFVPSINWRTVVLSTSNDLVLPRFSLHLRSQLHRQKRPPANVGDEVLMPPEFFKKYCLRGCDEKRIRTFFSPEIVSYYLHDKGLHTQAAGGTFIVYRPGRLVAADRLKPFVNEAIGLLGLFKAEYIRSGA